MGEMVIALDAGHGMKTAGKRCLKKLDPNETREWWLNDRIMDKVENTLKAQYDCTVIRLDDTTGVKDISLSARVKVANDAGAVVSIHMHHNAGLHGKNGGGMVVYYSSSKPERAVQAQALYDAIVAQTGLAGNRSQHIIKRGFYVIKKTTMPAFLVENGFMDSPTDVPIILSEDHACKTAAGVINFLETEFSVKRKADVAPSKPAETPKERTYTVKKGDSLWRIATYELGSGSRYKEIMDLSGLKSDVIRVGQVLVLPS